MHFNLKFEFLRSDRRDHSSPQLGMFPALLDLDRIAIVCLRTERTLPPRHVEPKALRLGFLSVDVFLRFCFAASPEVNLIELPSRAYTVLPGKLAAFPGSFIKLCSHLIFSLEGNVSY